MEDYNKGSKQKKSKDCQIEEMCGCTEEELLREFEASRLLKDCLPIPKAPVNEFEQIWSRIEDEHRESNHSETGKIIRGRLGWKRWAATAVIACLVAGSGCFVAMGTKSYFFREKELGNGQIKVYVNDSYKSDLNDEEEAYELIEDELNIKPLKLNFIPDKMEFSRVNIGEGCISIEFLYKDNLVYLVQSKYGKTAVLNFKADSDKEKKLEAYNKWLRMDLDIKKETLSNGNIAYETSIITNGASYTLMGVAEKEIFIKMVEELAY